MLLFVLAACSNLEDRSFHPEGGARYTTGSWEPFGADTGGGDTSEDSGGGYTDDGLSPFIDAVSAALTGADDNGNVYVDVSISCSDPQDDLVGGKVNFDYAQGDDAGTYDNRSITSDTETYDTASQAGYANGTVVMQLGPIDAERSFSLTQVYLQDAAGHTSNEVDAATLEP